MCDRQDPEAVWLQRCPGRWLLQCRWWAGPRGGHSWLRWPGGATACTQESKEPLPGGREATSRPGDSPMLNGTTLCHIGHLCSFFFKAIDQIKKFHFPCVGDKWRLCPISQGHQGGGPSTSKKPPWLPASPVVFKTFTWSLVLRNREWSADTDRAHRWLWAESPESCKTVLGPRSTVGMPNMPIWALGQRSGPDCPSPGPATMSR